MGWKRNYPALRLPSSGVFPACPARELPAEQSLPQGNGDRRGLISLVESGQGMLHGSGLMMNKVELFRRSFEA
jgi:hypothetical protein